MTDVATLAADGVVLRECQVLADAREDVLTQSISLSDADGTCRGMGHMRMAPLSLRAMGTSLSTSGASFLALANATSFSGVHHGVSNAHRNAYRGGAHSTVGKTERKGTRKTSRSTTTAEGLGQSQTAPW